ncbi:MAG: hypothetical protein VCB25_03890, partial [Myxococcota bacterium]
GGRHRPPSYADGANSSLPDQAREVRLRPIEEVRAADQVADFTSDLGRPSFGTVRGARAASA